MKPFVFIFTFLAFSPLFAQTHSNQMREITQDLIRQLSRSKKVKELAIMRLEYSGSTTTEIGKYFADELSYSLIQHGTSFNVINTNQVEDAIQQYEAKKAKQATNQPNNSTTTQPQNSNANKNNGSKENVDWLVVGGAAVVLSGIALLSKDKGPLPKVTHFVSGTIVDKGDELEVTYVVTDKKKNNAVVANARARFLKTPDITSKLNPVQPSLANPNQSGNSITPGGYTPPSTASTYTGPNWRNNAVVMEMVSCTQSGQNIECELRVTARENDIQFKIYRGSTILFAAENQNEFYPFEVVIGDRSTTGYAVDKTLIAKYNAKIILRFTQVQHKVRNIAALKIHCSSTDAGYYTAEFYSVPVN